MAVRTLRPLVCALVLACGIASGSGRDAVECEGPCTLDLAHPQGQRAVGPDLTAPERSRFVQVDVAAVENPGGIPLSFVVHYLPVHGSGVVLGSFSLFPPDQPGRFIVATGGRLRRGGTVRVSLEPLVAVGAEVEVRVRLGGIALVGGEIRSQRRFSPPETSSSDLRRSTPGVLVLGQISFRNASFRKSQ